MYWRISTGSTYSGDSLSLTVLTGEARRDVEKDEREARREAEIDGGEARGEVEMVEREARGEVELVERQEPMLYACLAGRINGVSDD